MLQSEKDVKGYKTGRDWCKVVVGMVCDVGVWIRKDIRLKN